MDHIDVGGVRIAYEQKGEGPPIVLLHGFAADGREWRGQLSGLSNQFTVVAWDAPGSGGSADPPASWRMPDYADCLAQFIAALALERPHVIGLSWGGALALELYRRHPRIPRSLILASAYAGWSGSLDPDARDQRLRSSLELADQPMDQFVSALLPTMFSATASAERISGFRALMLEVHPAGFRTMAHALAEADLRDVLPRIRVPTLLLYGDQDVRAPLTVAKALHAAIPDSTLAVLLGVGHIASVEVPDRFNAEVRRFLLGQPVVD